MHLYEVLRRPLITEKNTTLQAAQNKYAFEVAHEANKALVKEAVEKSFKVKVLGVNILNVPGKMRRVGRRIAATPAWKKAVVTLRPGDKIEFFEGV